jgi:hypothetical protein
MDSALLTVMVLWISTSFEAPPNYAHPNIELVPATEIIFLRSKLDTSLQQQ